MSDPFAFRSVRVASSWGSPGLLLLILSWLAIAAEASTRQITLKESNPLLRESTLLLFNVGLVLVVAVQVMRGLRQRRNKFKAVPPEKLAAEKAARGAASAPAPARATASLPRASPGSAGAAKVLTKCANCGASIRVPGAKRPVQYRCPTCKAIGVLR